MNEIIFFSVSLSELDSLIQKSVKRALSEKSEPVQTETPDRCELDEAVKIIGFSKSQIYQLTHKNDIPFRKFGKRLVFSRKELLSWMEEHTTSFTPDDSLVTARLAKSAINKSR